MIIARQATSRTVTVGPVMDADGVAVTTSVVGDFKISKNGGAPAALNGSATLTHRNTGHYSLALTATDLDTVGQAEIVIDATVNACPIKCVTVVEEAVYDALFAASAPGYLQPTTAGRTLDVSAGGEAGVDWANVGSPTTTLNLSGTTVKTATDVETDTADIQSRLPAALGANGNIKADVRDYGGTAGTATSGIPSVALSSDYYHADIQFVRDQANTQDEWTVTWYKNGVRVTASITSPTLQLVKRADGTDLKAATAMTQVGSTGTYKLDLTGADRVTVGEAVLAVVAATIDAGSRTFARLIGRDSS